ncbi:MAG: LmbE-like protein [Peptococcaceae bacterium]|nr:LmbE-like protein [Peptococcaceae bacterium]
MHGKKDILLLATYGMEIVECGGTLAKHVKAGGNVQAAVSLVRPENREQVQKAAGVLGVKVSFLDFKSGEVQADVASKSKIVRLIREIRPEIIITQDPEHSFLDLDPDRREAMVLYLEAISLAARDWKVEECGNLKPHLVKSIYFMTPERPNCIIDIAEVFHFKEQAMAELTGQLAFTAEMLGKMVSATAMRCLLTDYEQVKDVPVELGRALHREMNRAFHLYHGLLSHSSFVLAEPFRRLGRFELEYLL